MSQGNTVRTLAAVIDQNLSVRAVRDTTIGWTRDPYRKGGVGVDMMGMLALVTVRRFGHDYGIVWLEAGKVPRSLDTSTALVLIRNKLYTRLANMQWAKTIRAVTFYTDAGLDTIHTNQAQDAPSP